MPPAKPPRTDTTTTTTTEPSAQDEPTPGDAAPSASAEQQVARVEVRWISPQTMLLAKESRIVGYGDTFTTRADRVPVDDRLILASEPWTPDPAFTPDSTKE